MLDRRRRKLLPESGPAELPVRVKRGWLPCCSCPLKSAQQSLLSWRTRDALKSGVCVVRNPRVWSARDTGRQHALQAALSAPHPGAALKPPHWQCDVGGITSFNSHTFFP